MNALAVGAHPDDIELGCAGTILSITKRGVKVWGLILTNGEKGGDPEVFKNIQKASAPPSADPA